MWNQRSAVASAIRRVAFPATLIGFIAVSCRDFGDYSLAEPSPSVGGSGGTVGGTTGNGNQSGRGPSASEGGEAGSSIGGMAGPSGGSGGAEPTGGQGGSGSGGANESGNGGEGGRPDGGTSGGVGGETNGEEVILTPTCLSSTGSIPPYPFDAASDVAASDLYYFRPAAVFATQPRLNVALATWSSDASGNEWVPWGCFDPLLNPQRIAATNLSNNYMEVFAIANGQLQARRIHDVGWSSWTSVSMPRASGARDIAMLGNPQVEKTEVYLAGTSRLYRRQRVSSEPYANLGPWQVFSEVELRAVAVGQTLLGMRWVVGVDTDGQILATNTASNEGAHLGAFGSVEGGAVDVAAGYESNQALFFVAADAEGGVWRLKVSAGTGEWTLLKAPAQPPKIRAISVGSSPGEPPLLFGVDVDGRVHHSLNGADWASLD